MNRDYSINESMLLEFAPNMNAQERNERLVARLKAYYEALSKYERVKEPDKDALSELTIQAKGPKRSMRKFAEEMDTNASTLSRIVNKKTSGTNSNDLIVKIAYYADPNSGVTLDKLLEAHGMKLRESINEDVSVTFDHMEYEQLCNDIIKSEITKRGYDVSENDTKFICGPGYRMHFDYTIDTNAVYTTREWKFEYKYFNSKSRPYKAIAMQWINLMMSAFYCKNLVDTKVSLVVNSLDIYERIVNSLDGIVIPDDMSIILIDTENRKIVKEYIIPKSCGVTPNSIFSTTSSEDIVDTGDVADWDLSIYQD